jgi:hypothetical protein
LTTWKLDPDLAGDPPGVLDVLHPGAVPDDAVLVDPVLHVGAGHVEALPLQEEGGDRAVDAAGHGDKDSFAFWHGTPTTLRRAAPVNPTLIRPASRCPSPRIWARAPPRRDRRGGLPLVRGFVLRDRELLQELRVLDELVAAVPVLDDRRQRLDPVARVEVMDVAEHLVRRGVDVAAHDALAAAGRASSAMCSSKFETWLTADLTRALIALLRDQYSSPRQDRQTL